MLLDRGTKWCVKEREDATERWTGRVLAPRSVMRTQWWSRWVFNVQRSTFKLPHSRLGGRWFKTVPKVPWMQTVAAGIERCPSHGVDRHRFSISISVQYLKCKLLLVLYLGKRRRISLIRPTIRYYRTSFWSQILGFVEAETLSHLLAFCTGRRPCQTVMMYRQR